MATTKITAKELAAIKTRLTASFGREATPDEMRSEIARLRQAAAPAASKATKSTSKAAPAAPKAPARVLPPAPKDWSATASNTHFLRYTRRSKVTGHIVDIYDVEHGKCPAKVDILGLAGQAPSVAEVVLRDVPGTGRFVVVDRNTGATARASAWAPAYAASRTVDGQPAPASKYIARYFEAPEAAQAEQAAPASAKGGGKGQKSTAAA